MADALAELASLIGAVEKVRQRRSRPLVVLTYSVYVPRTNGPAALPEEKHVLACTGWAGETGGHFEQPLFLLTRERFGQYSPI